MVFKLKKNKSDIVGHVTPIALGIAGGFGGNQLTSVIEKQSFMAGFESYAPAVTLLGSVAIGLLVPNQMVKDIANGAAIVSGTELIEGLISGSTVAAPVKAVKGVAPVQMGYTPDIAATGPNGYKAFGGGSVN
jgi:hypothetical protein